MEPMEIVMRRKKLTDYKVRFRDNLERIGNLYLPIPSVERMKIENEIIVQLAPNKDCFAPGGYITKMIKEKETDKKIRFKEDLSEGGELSVIYVSKDLLKKMNLESDEIAVKIISPIS